ncbi:hypothetical protein GCM10010174_61200 [Kutzneria viridogrisea]|uniref:DUF397 domain-containing protein n=1 Tax=Kutzneria viridogrisea TaxID=47990 RepID=A0ABR6BGR8_9PSEU|nr:hypothetical protein [Kutzneria viridogrisea]
MTPDLIEELSNAVWVKSTQSNGQGAECVETARLTHAKAIRDSKNKSGGVLIFSDRAFDTFIQGAKAGDFGPA